MTLPTSPAALRSLAAFQEAVSIEQEVRKGETGHPTVVARADLLRKDVCDRWRTGEGLVQEDPTIAQALGRFAEIA
jgi:antirestriction protein ArdC